LPRLELVVGKSGLSGLSDMERHYKTVKNKWIGFAGGLKE
jgi:hypothetical protein